MATITTLTKSGLGDIVGGSGWLGVVAPFGTSPAIIKRRNDEINAALKLPDVIKRLRKAYAFAEVDSHLNRVEKNNRSCVTQLGLSI